MPSVNTNILRLQVEGLCYEYQLHPSKEMEEEDKQQLQKYIEENNRDHIYEHPYLYAVTQPDFDAFVMAFSRGATIKFELKLLQANKKTKYIKSICFRLLRTLNFLNCPQIQASFNAFEQHKNTDGEIVIPGLSIEAVFSEHWIGLCLIPLNMLLGEPKDISSSKILMDYSCGRFYERLNIVRVDKTRNQIHFRNGEIIELSQLKTIKLKNMIGYELALKMNNALERLKDEGQTVMKKWGLSFESQFLEIESGMVKPGSIGFRNSVERNLNDFVFAMARNAYNHYHRTAFKDVFFEDLLETEICMFCHQKVGKLGGALKREFEALNNRMGLRLTSSLIYYASLEKFEELNYMVQKEVKNRHHMHTFIVPAELSKAERDTINNLRQTLISQQIYFHFIELDQKYQDEVDMLALRHLSMLYAKYRLNPWKIRVIPFGEKPTVICNVNVQQRSDNQFSVCIVSSLNSYFSKFCCFHALANDHELEEAIFFTLRQSLDKFCSIHKTYPIRLFVFRTGFVPAFSEEYFSIRNRLTNYYSQIKNTKINTLTYIKLSKAHSIRTFKQVDTNSITYQSVKKTELLSVLELNGKFYLQLEFDEPMTEVEVMERENDPGFMPKILELIVKLCFGSVGNEFGRGRGFFDFAQKLNEYKDYDLSGWKDYLREGYLMFL